MTTHPISSKEIIPLINKCDYKTDLMDKPEDTAILSAAGESDIPVLSEYIKKVPESAYKSYEPSKDTFLHRIAEGGYPDCVQAAELIFDNCACIEINAKNAKGDTALHNVLINCNSDRLDLVNLFIQRGANVSIPSGKGENAFHLLSQFDTPKAIEIVETLLSQNHESRDLLWSKSTQGGGRNAFHFAAKNCAVNMLKHLWGKCQGDVSLVSENNIEHGTPLHIAVQKGESPKTVKTVNFLLSILPKEKINELSHGNSPLHLAAKGCYVNVLTALVSHIKVNVFKSNKDGETCLDILAGVSDENPDGVRCVQALLKKSHQLSVEAEKRRCIFQAIDVAVTKRSTNMAELLIKEHGNISNVRSEGLLDSIYENVPVAVIPMLNKAVTYKPSKDQDDLENISVDMGAIIGFNGASGNESEALFGIFKTSKKQQRKIFEHPVVNVFLKEKWRKLKPFTYVYILLYVTWLILYSMLHYELYSPECPTELQDSANKTETAVSSLNGNRAMPKLFLYLTFQDIGSHKCAFNVVTARFLATLLYGYTLFFIAQEVIKFSLAETWRSYFSGLTILQIVRHLGVAINISSAFMNSEDIPNFQYHLGGILFCLSWLLLLSELAYIPSFALFLSILMKTVWNYGKFMGYFIPILIAFVPVLSRYVGKGKQFNFPLFGVIKNFILMTGEVDYKETFYSDDGPNLAPYDIIGQFIVLVTVFGFGLVLANVLTGVAVKNFQDLYRDAEYETAAMQLKSIHFMDSLVVWMQQWPITTILSGYFKNLRLEYDGETREVKGIKAHEYSDELKQRIHKLLRQKK